MIVIYLKMKRKNNQKERKIQLQICDWLKQEYPDLLFMCDIASGMRMSIGQAMLGKRMRCNRALPDLYIFARSHGGTYHGLVLELKKDEKGVYLKNGELSKNKHISEQTLVLERFTEHGFFADFGCGFENSKRKIINYLTGK